MPNYEIGPLAKKLPDLHKEKEVEVAVAKDARLTGEKRPNIPEAKIDAYLKRLENIFLNPDERVRERNLELLRPHLHDEFVISRSDIPESFFELQQRIARERGEEVSEIPQRVKEQMKDVIIEDQESSLDAWVDYLTSEDAVYPTWFKYFAFRNLVKMSQFDAERGVFKKRSKDTTAPFPDVQPEVLAQVADKLIALAQGDISKFSDDAEFSAYASQKFPDLYAAELKKVEQAKAERGNSVEGEWVKYNYSPSTSYSYYANPQERVESPEAHKLYMSLQGKSTGWCTAGESTARAQIASGDFYVFYSKDKDGNPTQPRVAIRMNGTGDIAEIRGILPHQEMEPELQEVLDEKLATFGKSAERFRKRAADMKQLTQIDKLTAEGAALTAEDLRFLYELDGHIQGFGQHRADPRIKEIRGRRNVPEDLRIIVNGERISQGKEPLQDDESEQELVNYFIERGRGADVLAYLDQFKGIDNSALALQLLESKKGTSLLVENLGKFKELPLEVATKLVETKHTTDVGRHIQSFKEIDSKIAEKLMRTGYRDWVVSSINRFTQLSNSVATGIINDGKPAIVAENLDRFQDLSNETAKALIRWSFIPQVLAHVDRFRQFDAAVAERLIEKGYAQGVLDNFDRFPQIGNAFPLAFIKSDQGKLFGENIDKFKGAFGSSVAEALIEHKLIPILGKNLERFGALDTSVAVALVGAGFEKEVAANLSVFKTAPSYMARAFLDAGYVRFVTERLKIPLKEEQMLTLIHEGKGPIIALGIQRIDPKYHPVIADSLIQNGNIHALLHGLENFHGLPNEIARELISSGFIENVKMHHTSFPDLTSEDIAEYSAKRRR